MDPEQRRRAMVAEQIEARGVSDPRVLEAMRTVPRDRFVPAEAADRAYGDHPLGIGAGQTISQPYVVALMAEAAQIGPRDRVLEVGTGSGYAAAVLALLGDEVYTLERHESLVRDAKDALAATAALCEIDLTKVHVIHADGVRGWPDAAPYDAILVTAAGTEVPEALLEQLADGGRLVMPVGDDFDQELIRVRRVGDSFEIESLGPVRFVPLLPGTTGTRPDDGA